MVPVSNRNRGMTKLEGILIVAVLVIGALAGYGYLRPPVVVKEQVVTTREVVRTTEVTKTAEVIKEPASLKVNLAWIPSGRHVALYVALDKGFYDQEGLSVKLVRGFGSVRAVTEVAEGLYEIAIPAHSAVVVGVSKGQKVKTIMDWDPVFPHGIAALKESGIKSLKDLEGKSVATSTGAIHDILTPLQIKNAGGDVDKVKMVTMTPSLFLPSLFEKKIQAMPAWKYAELGPLLAEAKKLGKEVIWWSGTEVGLDKLASITVVASERVINEKPDVVRRFIKATLRGVDYSIKNTDEAFNIFLNYNTGVSVEGEKINWSDWSEDAKKVIAKKGSFGLLDPEIMKSSVDLYKKAFDVKVDIPVDATYTAVFLKS